MAGLKMRMRAVSPPASARGSPTPRAASLAAPSAVDSGRLERLVEDPARRADERLAGAVLLIARLLAHEDGACAGGALAEDRLRAHLPEVAAAAACRRLA